MPLYKKHSIKQLAYIRLYLIQPGPTNNKTNHIHNQILLAQNKSKKKFLITCLTHANFLKFFVVLYYLY